MGGQTAILGLILGVGALLLAVILEGGSLGALLNFPAALIVLGGTAGATIVSHSTAELRKAARALRIILTHRSPDVDTLTRQLRELAETARRDGLLALENVSISEPFLRSTIQMVADGLDPKLIDDILNIRIEAEQDEMERLASVFETAGGYAPTMGILGTVMGLMNVLGHLEDPAQVGHSIAGAFAATMYGVGVANLLFLPYAARIRTIAGELWRQKLVVLEGALGIARGENPRIVEMKLRTFRNHATEAEVAEEEVAVGGR